MSEPSTEQTGELLDSLYRGDSGRILATLIRLLGDFDLARKGSALPQSLVHRCAAEIKNDSPHDNPEAAAETITNIYEKAKLLCNHPRLGHRYEAEQSRLFR